MKESVLEKRIKNNINHLEKLEKISLKTFGEELWKPELRLLRGLLK